MTSNPLFRKNFPTSNKRFYKFSSAQNTLRECSHLPIFYLFPIFFCPYYPSFSFLSTIFSFILSSPLHRPNPNRYLRSPLPPQPLQPSAQLQNGFGFVPHISRLHLLSLYEQRRGSWRRRWLWRRISRLPFPSR